MSKKFLIFTILFAFLFFSIDVMAQPCSSTKLLPRCSPIMLGAFPFDNSPDGLKLMGGNVCHVSQAGVPVKVGSKICVRFRLCNPTNQPITFDSNGVFVGARWNSTTNANNRDFGHQYRNYVLQPGQSIILNAEITVNAPGTWRFWPAYHINGHYGPFRWHEVVVNVSQ